MIGFGLLALAACFFFLDWISARARGDCKLALAAGKIFNAFRLEENGKILFSFDVPLENHSPKEQALVIYGQAAVVPRDRQAKTRPLWTSLTLAKNPRLDGYFEAVLVKPEKSVPLRVRVLFEKADFLKQERLDCEVSYSYYGRTPMKTDRVSFQVPFEIFRAASGEPSAPAGSKSAAAAKPGVVPIPTHLIFPGEDLSRVIRQYTQGRFKPGDWAVLAESVVAIAQGRAHPVSGIRPGFWARRLNRFFRFDSSMASCYSMQCAIEEAGLARIFLAVLAGLLGKASGRSGDFYRVAGRGVAAIDDCTGTLPPFDKSVVMGPKDAPRVASEIARETGFEAAVVDANDLKKVDILGKSAGIVDRELIEALLDNPQGNADEQTPIVMIQR